MKKKISITIEESILSKIDSVIDNIYIRNRSQAIEFLTTQSIMENRTAIILAGGEEESRKIKGRYRIEYTLERMIKILKKNSFTKIIIIAQSGPLTKAFEILKDGSGYGISITYLEEKDSKGSFQSLKLLKGKVQGKFLCVYCDLIIDKIKLEELWNDHLISKATSTIVMTTTNKPSEKGTLIVEGNRVLKFTQKPKNSDIYLVFSPIFVCESEILDMHGSSLELEIFPELAKKGLLNGHLSGNKEQHIHSEKDLEHSG